MNQPTGPTAQPRRAAVVYRSADAVRRRSVSRIVLSSVLDLPSIPPRLSADWLRETAADGLAIDVGDVVVMPLARARVRWPGYRHCVQAVIDWASAFGLGEVVARTEVALMACRGARYHHDAQLYGEAAFCNVFVSDERGLELHFPDLERRISLTRGTVVIFDTAQPHAVVPHGAPGFAAEDFRADRDWLQCFLTWELPIDAAPVASVLNIEFDGEPEPAARVHEPGSRLHDGIEHALCSASGTWHRAG